MKDTLCDTTRFVFGEPDEVLGYVVVGKNMNYDTSNDNVHVLWSDDNNMNATGNSHTCWNFYHTLN